MVMIKDMRMAFWMISWELGWSFALKTDYVFDEI